MRLVKVETKKHLKQFIDFPHNLYKDDPCYVPEIYLAMQDHLNPKKNPYFKHSAASLFLAIDDREQIVGRIAVTNNINYNAYHNSNVGFFGFFDTIDDIKVAEMLLNKAEDYCKNEGLDKILGPCNFTTNDTATMLVEGFDSPPVVQMTYNRPYYPVLVEQLGYGKEMDFFAFDIKTNKVNEKALRLAEVISSRLKSKGITLRNVSKKNWKQEVESIRGIYKQAWEKNWGFVPPTNEEFDFLAEGLKLIIDERYAFVVEHQGKPVAFAVGLPNINEIVISMPKGRLLPFGIFKLLTRKSKTKSIRIVLLGVIEDYRKLGIEGLFFARFIQAAKENGLVGGEASWILENNQMMVQAAEKLNGDPYKRYRIYSKML